MAMVLPGVTIGKTQLISGEYQEPVTEPLFIGYTPQKPLKSHNLIHLVSISQITQWVGNSGTLYQALRHFFDNGGTSCYLLSLGCDDQWANQPLARIKALIKSLQDAEYQALVAAENRVGLLLAPEISELNDLPYSPEIAALWQQGWRAMLQLCAQGKFALLDTPDAPSQLRVLLEAHFSGERLTHGAAWWPRLETTYHGESGKRIILSPLPATAAAIQNNARNYGIWQPPANIPLASTLKPTHSVIQSPELINQTGLYCNVIRSFVNKGVRLWGCRTLLNNEHSPWRYIQIRLFVNSIYNQLNTLMRAYLFEPNNVLTWTKLKGQTWSYLRQLWLEGAFYGTQEEAAFQLSIGLGETMTAKDISDGRLIMKVQLALLAPAEFIELSMTLDINTSTAQLQPEQLSYRENSL